MKKTSWIIVISIAVLAIFVIFEYSRFWVRHPEFDLKEEEFGLLIREAVIGNTQAARRISDFYFYKKKDPVLGFFWQEQAVLGGDEDSKKHLRSFISSTGVDDYRILTKQTNSIRETAVLDALGLSSIEQTNKP